MGRDYELRQQSLLAAGQLTALRSLLTVSLCHCEPSCHRAVLSLLRPARHCLPLCQRASSTAIPKEGSFVQARKRPETCFIARLSNDSLQPLHAVAKDQDAARCCSREPTCLACSSRSPVRRCQFAAGLRHVHSAVYQIGLRLFSSPHRNAASPLPLFTPHRFSYCNRRLHKRRAFSCIGLCHRTAHEAPL